MVSSNIVNVANPAKRQAVGFVTPAVTFNPSKVDVTKPTYVSPTYRPRPPPSTTTTPRPTEAGYPYYHQETGVRQRGHRHRQTAPQPKPVSRPGFHVHEEEEDLGDFTSFSQTVNHIRDEYDSQKAESPFAPSATENAPTPPAPPTTTTVGSRQKSNNANAYPQKLKKVVRKKRYRPHHPQPDFTFAGIGSTLDSAIGSALGSVGQLFGGGGGATRSTANNNNNLQFEKFQSPFIPSATLQPDGNQFKREIASNAPAKDESSGSSAAIPAIPAIPSIPAIPPIPAIPDIPPPRHQSTDSYQTSEQKATSGSHSSLNEHSGKTTSTSHKANAPISPQQRPQQIAYPPYRSNTPAFVRDEMAKYTLFRQPDADD